MNGPNVLLRVLSLKAAILTNIYQFIKHEFEGARTKLALMQTIPHTQTHTPTQVPLDYRTLRYSHSLNESFYTTEHTNKLRGSY